MIGRPTKGRGFRGLLNYLADQDHARRLGGDMAGRNPRELAHEFGLVRRQRPRVKRAVAHMFLRPAPGEHLSDDQWKTIATYYLTGMGFADSPHVLYLHAKPHPHLHLVASRITYGGQVVSDSNDYSRSAALLRNIERQYGLRVVPVHPDLASPSRGDFERSRRTKTPPLKTRLQEILAAAPYPATLADYLDHLHRHGLAMLPNIARTGRVSGISYLFEGYVMKASDLGREHSWAALQRRLIATPQDPGLLVAERTRAEEALGPFPGPQGAAVALGPSAPDASPALPAQDHRIFEQLAAAEHALKTSSPETYLELALAYNTRASSAERLLTASLGSTEPRSPEAEALVRSLLAEPGAPPTPELLDQLLHEDEAAHADLLGLASPAGPPPSQESFEQAVARVLDSRRELHRFDLTIELRLQTLSAQGADISPDTLRADDPSQEVVSLRMLRERVELAGLQREMALRRSLPQVSDDYFVLLDDLLLRQIGLERRIALAESFLRFEVGQAPLPTQSGVAPGPWDVPREDVSHRVHQILGEAAAAERRLLSASPENLREHLWDYLRTVDSTRSRILQAFEPGETSTLRPADHLAGQQVARILIHDTPQPPLTLRYLDSLAAESNEAFGALLERRGVFVADPEAITRLIAVNHEIDRVAVHAGVALYDLSSSNLPLTEDERLQASYLEAIETRVELHAVASERAFRLHLDEQDPLHQTGLIEEAFHHIRELENRLDDLESLPLPARVAGDEIPLGVEDHPPGDPLVIDARDLDATAIAEAFRAEARFSPDPPFPLAPTPEELPDLAREAHEAFDARAQAELALRNSTPETYPALALSHAGRSALAERLEQQLATFGPEPVPRNLPEPLLSAYLETRRELHETLAAPPSLDRDLLATSLEARLAEISPPPPPRPLTQRSLSAILDDHHRAYDEVRRQLVTPAENPDAFKPAVARALDRHLQLERFSLRLEGHLHSLEREHALLTERLPEGASSESRRLRAIDRRVETLEPLYQQARIAIADRDLEILERHLRSHPSSETLDRYTELLYDRGRLLIRLRESRAEDQTSIPTPDLASARQAFLGDPSEGNLLRYRLAASAEIAAAERASLAAARAAVTDSRGELREIAKQANRRKSARPATPGETNLYQAANRYLDTRENLADHGPRPPRRGTTFDYAAHARETDLSPAALDRLRASAALDHRRLTSSNPSSLPPRPIPPELSRDEALRLAVERLRRAEASLNAHLRGLEKIARQAPPGSPPRATPEKYGRLVRGIDRYQDALTQVERLSRSRNLLSPREFLRHPVFHSRPLRALAAWTGYAARKGRTPSQIRRSLRAFALPFVAGAAARGVQHLATSFLRDQVHER
jgi:relaxase-like protein